MESIFDQEIKTALQVSIVSTRYESNGLMPGSGITYFTIQMTKIYSGEQGYIERKLSEFYTLNDDLKARAYRGLPKLPAKTIMNVRGNEQQEKRKVELINYLRELIERRDTRNSQEVIEFLELDEFAQEVLIQKPQLITKWNCNSQQPSMNVAHCLFLPKHNVFVLALNTNVLDKKGKKVKSSVKGQQAHLQIHSFRQVSHVRDSYVLKNGDAHLLNGSCGSTQAQSLSSDSFEESKQPTPLGGLGNGRTQSAKFSSNQNTSSESEFSFKSDANDQQNTHYLQQRSQSERAKRTRTYLRESMVESFASGMSYTGEDSDEEEEEVTELLLDHKLGIGTKVKAMTYCDELDILSLAFNDGSIQSFHVSIQLDKDNEAEDENYGEDVTHKSYLSRVILKRTFDQGEASHPCFYNEEQKLMAKRRAQQQQYFQQQYSIDRFSIQVERYSEMQVHKEGYQVTDMKADSQRGLLYTCGTDKRVCIVNVNQSIIESTLKLSNSQIKCLALDSDLKRLYAGTAEGMLLILNVSLSSINHLEPAITLVHSMSFQPGLSPRKLDYDSNRNIIFCLLKSKTANHTQQAGDQYHQYSQVVCVQLDQKREKRSAIVDTILSPLAFAGESFTRMAWLSRVQCTLLTASDRGILRFYDLESGTSEPILFQLAPPGNLSPAALRDFQSTFLYYCRDRNIIFAGARDGRIGVWRLPEVWRSKEIDQLEREFEFSRKQMMKIKAKANAS